MTIKTKFEVEGLQTIISQLKTFGTAGEDAAKQLKQAIDNVNTKKLEQDVANVAKSFDGLVTSVLNFKNILAATAIGTAATALFEFAKSGIEAAVSIERNAAAAGVSAQQYQVLSEAMKRAGGSQEQLNTALRRFTTQVGTQGPEQLKAFTDVIKLFVEQTGGVSSIVFKTAEDFKKIQDAAGQAAPKIKAMLEALGDPRGAQSIEAISAKLTQLLQQSPELRKLFADIGIATPAKNIIESLAKIQEQAKGTFASLGISLIDLSGKIKTPEKAFLEFIDVVSKMKTPAEQASAIVKVFGRQAGPELAKLIREGTASLEEISNFLKSRGLLFSPEQLEEAHKAEIQIKQLEGAFTSFKNQVSVALAPAFIDFFKELSKQLDEFIKGGGIEKTKDAVLSIASVGGKVKDAFDGVAADLNKAFSTDLSGTKLMLGLIALRALLLVVNPLLIALGVALGAAGEAPPPTQLSTWDALLQNIGKDIDTVKNRIKELTGQPIEAAASDAGQQASANFEQGINLSGARSKFQELYDFAKSLFADPITVMFQANPFLSQQPTSLASGGMVRGPGSTTSDSIFALLSNKEFVVNARAVSHYGPDLFAALNAMRLPRDYIGKFNMGGLASALSNTNRFAAGGQVRSGNPVVLNIDRQSFNMSAGDDTITQLKRFAVTAQLSSSGRKPRWVR